LGKGVESIKESSRFTGGFDLDKPLYTISVASEILETHPRTLMMYEDLGLIEPYRTATNRRRYSQRNIRKLQVIQQLTRERGVNLAGVKYILMLLATLKDGKVAPPEDLRPVYELYREII
jgi:MerR family transcriptional regulator/heat shock protein HspR